MEMCTLIVSRIMSGVYHNFLSGLLLIIGAFVSAAARMVGFLMRIRGDQSVCGSLPSTGFW
jgi:hypothetical protein